jgi:hypothetical protein
MALSEKWERRVEIARRMMRRNQRGKTTMLDRSKDSLTFECDMCGEVLETNTKEFNEALDTLRNDGWISKGSVGDGWAHFCPDCLVVTMKRV